MTLRQLTLICLAVLLLGNMEAPLFAEESAPMTVYVDDDWTGPDHCGGHAWGVDAFNTIQQGLHAVASGGTVTVAPGAYAERLRITKPLKLHGPRKGVSPNAGTEADPFAPSTVRTSTEHEAMLLPPNTDLTEATGAMISVCASDVTIDGLTVHGGVPPQTAAPQSATGIGIDGHYHNLLIANTVIRNCQRYGIYMRGVKEGTTGNALINNRIEHIPGLTPTHPGVGVFLTISCFTEVYGNTVTDVAEGLITHNFRGAGHVTLTRNRIRATDCGIGATLFYQTMQRESPGATIAQNIIQAGVPTTEERQSADTLHAHAGIRLLFLHTRVPITVTGNTVTGGYAGVTVMNCSGLAQQTNSGITITGGDIRQCERGVWITNNNFTLGKEQKGGERPGKVILDGVRIHDSAVAGLYLEDEARTGLNDITVLLTNNATITAGASGAIVKGQRVTLLFSTATVPAASFLQIPGDYLTLLSNGVASPATLDASAVLFDGKRGVEMTAAEVNAWETKITDQADNPSVGRVTR